MNRNISFINWTKTPDMFTFQCRIFTTKILVLHIRYVAHPKVYKMRTNGVRTILLFDPVNIIMDYFLYNFNIIPKYFTTNGYVNRYFIYYTQSLQLYRVFHATHLIQVFQIIVLKKLLLFGLLEGIFLIKIMRLMLKSPKEAQLCTFNRFSNPNDCQASK